MFFSTQDKAALASLHTTTDLDGFIQALSRGRDEVGVIDHETCRRYEFKDQALAEQLLRFIQQDRFKGVRDIGRARIIFLPGTKPPYRVYLMHHTRVSMATPQAAAQGGGAAKEFDGIFSDYKASQAFVIAIEKSGDVDTFKAEVKGLEKDFHCSFGIKFDRDGYDGSDVIHRIGSFTIDKPYSEFTDSAWKRLGEIDGVLSVRKMLFPEIVIDGLRSEAQDPSNGYAM